MPLKIDCDQMASAIWKALAEPLPVASQLGFLSFWVRQPQYGTPLARRTSISQRGFLGKTWTSNL
jgi:hypothetical protein